MIGRCQVDEDLLLMDRFVPHRLLCLRLDGRDGSDGVPGSRGSVGAARPAGRDGVNGYVGRDGSDGARGSQGWPRGSVGAYLRRTRGRTQ